MTRAQTMVESRDLCIMACAFCRYADFLVYLQAIDPQHEPWTEAGAKQFILSACDISSRADLDRDGEAAQRFHERVRLPYLAWKAGDQRGGI
jgi:hypothetical protein